MFIITRISLYIIRGMKSKSCRFSRNDFCPFWNLCTCSYVAVNPYSLVSPRLGINASDLDRMDLLWRRRDWHSMHLQRLHTSHKIQLCNFYFSPLRYFVFLHIAPFIFWIVDIQNGYELALNCSLYVILQRCLTP